jgi:predicted AlkP superfamily phosphohydrolase/phosphomutase
MMKKTHKALTLFLFLFLIWKAPLHAYVGPGAGFAFLSSFLVLFLTFFLAVFSLLSWPFRFLFRLIRGQKSYKNSLADQLVIVGLDGLEPTLTEKYMQQGNLPNLSRLKKTGTYAHLKTTTPAISPVAWSSFMTGCHPAKHNIFDFLSRDPKTYLPNLSSARIGEPKRFFKLGKYKIPLSKPVIQGLRKSIPFWKILGDEGIFSTILRIPITFPPEKFKGHCLSGMCAPDLKGSQGTFTFYTSEDKDIEEGGVSIPVQVNNNHIQTIISGPVNSLVEGGKELTLPLSISLDPEKKEAVLDISGQTVRIKEKKFSDWVKITFRPGLGMKIRSICRFYISAITPQFKMYCTPLNIDPEKPALPISHPFIFSVYLSKLFGPFTTLGEADDTWALNEGVLDEDTFIQSAYDTNLETEKMLINAIKKNRKGVVACWFQATDSLQHMFFRYLDHNHPALKHGNGKKSSRVIKDLYVNMDQMVGRIIDQLSPKTALLIMSDHGFKSFRRGVHLNSWLYRNGYLALKDGKQTSGEWFKDVDWSRTKAYGLGLGGLYINQKGRESQGIVEPGEETLRLKSELKNKLESVLDDKTGSNPINKVYINDEIPSGPYLNNCPDIIMGYSEGYRVSWDSVTGKVHSDLFEDNIKAWSGDHCIDPDLVPGVLFCNYKINREDISITDIAPTALHIFGVPIPGHMDGKSMIERSRFRLIETKENLKQKAKKRPGIYTRKG